MKITNKYNLPAPLVQVLKKISSQYDKGKSDITATGLLEPVQMAHLKEKHKDEITEDAADLIYSAVGTSIHSMLEEAGNELREQGFIVEERFYMEVNGWVVGAKIDLFDTKTGTLWDYKNTSVYAVKDGPKEEYAKQLNIGAEALRQNGYEVKHLRIGALLRDWRKGEYQRDEHGSYPERQYKELEVPLIPAEEVQAYVLERVKTFQGAKSGIIPPCSAEERWATEDKWAVMQKGLKRAIKLCSTEAEALSLIEYLISLVDNKGKIYYTQFRAGESRRCKDYCPVSRFCPQFNKTKGN